MDAACGRRLRGRPQMSMLQDLERGRSLEIDALVSVVTELGRLTDVDAGHRCRVGPGTGARPHQWAVRLSQRRARRGVTAGGGTRGKFTRRARRRIMRRVNGSRQGRPWISTLVPAPTRPRQACGACTTHSSQRVMQPWQVTADLVDDPAACQIEIVRWPTQGWRPIDENSGDQGGITEGFLSSPGRARRSSRAITRSGTATSLAGAPGRKRRRRSVPATRASGRSSGGPTITPTAGSCSIP